MAKKPHPRLDPNNGPALHSARWRFGDFELNEGKRELTRYGKVLELEPKPLNMLMLMLRHPGELVTKSDLMEALWTGRIVTESVVSNCAAKLRGVLGDDNADVRLRTLHGYGYRLEANPTLVTADAPQTLGTSEFSAEQMVPLRRNWQLKRRLGASGETWLGEHTATGEQRVFKFALTPSRLSALKREVTLYRLLRQSLLDAAPIVELLDWNFDEPPWFIEAEYCALGSLAEYLDQSGGAKALTLAQRLEIVVQIAEALAKVHALGILHKDLKPANILLSPREDGQPRVHLGDFGAGRLIDLHQLEALAITRLGFTQFTEGGGGSSSTSTGTPLYYAPEVLSGQPATLKADIYALGVILYQLVAGDMRRLFAPGWENDVDDELLRDDIAECAAGNPASRLGDAQILAERLRRLPLRRLARAQQRADQENAHALQQQLLQAKTRRAHYRALALVALLGLGLTSFFFWRAHAAHTEAAQAAQTALATNQFLLQDLLSEVSRDDRPVQPLKMRDLLQLAAQKIDTRFANQPSIAISTRMEIGKALRQLGDFDAAAAQQELAFALAQKTPGTAPATRAAILVELMPMQQTLPQPLARAKHYLPIYQQMQGELGDSHPLILELEWQFSGLEHRAGLWRAAVARLRKTVAKAATHAQLSPALKLRMRITLAVFLFDLEHFEEAQALLDAVLPDIQKLHGESHRQEARVRLSLAEIQTAQKRFTEARSEIDRALKIIRKWELDPADLTELAGIFQVRLQIDRGDIAAARQDLKNLVDQVHGGSHAALEGDAIYQRLQGRIASLEQDFAKAETYNQKALIAALDQFGNSHPAVANLRVDYADSVCRQGALPRCLRMIKEIEPGFLDEVGSTHSYFLNYQKLIRFTQQMQSQSDAKKHTYTAEIT